MQANSTTALVTGAEGFIGSHLTERLLEEGYQVRAFVQYNSFNSWGWLDVLPEETRKTLEIVTGDIRDTECVARAVDGCDLIFHLAALIAIPYSYRAPEAYIDTNVKGTLNILNAARRYDRAQLIHTSTSEVYGTAQHVPISEQHPLNAQSPYAASKIAADQLALAYYRSFETPVSIVRPFNTYGPRQSARAVIATIITQLLAGNREISLGALHPTRDFTYVKDTVEGFLAAAQHPRTIGEIINIGSGFEISIADTAELIARIMDIDLKIISTAERYRPDKSEVERLWADNSKARQLMHWQPRYGTVEGFEKGLRETINWYSESSNRQSYKSSIYNI